VVLISGEFKVFKINLRPFIGMVKDRNGRENGWKKGKKRKENKCMVVEIG
jgi:hypothetical protein